MFTHRHTLILLAGTIGLGLTAYTTPAESQSSTNNAPVLEEIIVTATKRNERLLDVPISMTLMDSSTLEMQQSLRLQDYFAQIPGLQVSARDSGSLQIAIRGITTGGGTNPTVATTIDDVPMGSSSSLTYAGLNAIDLDPANLERVEVLRGPQGTLYGASSLGGLIRYVTVAPRMDEFSGSFRIDGFDVENGGIGRGARTFLNVPLVENRFAATVSAFYRRDPGIVDNLTSGKSNVDSADVWGGRISALWLATDNTKLRISGMYQRTDGDGSSNSISDRPDKLTRGLTQLYVPQTGEYQRKIRQVDATLNVDFGWANLTSISAYGKNNSWRRDDITPYLGFLTFFATGRDDLATVNYQPTEVKKFSQEVRLTSPSDDIFEWLIGLFYTDEDADTQYNIFPADPVTGERLPEIVPDLFPTTFKEKAVFGSGTYHFNERFDLQLGARWSENKQVFDEHISGPLFDPPYTVHAVSKDDSFTYVVSPQFKLNADHMLYARVATGYRPGGPNPGAGFGTFSQYDADTTVSYELGWKAELLGKRLFLDASAYYIDWKDIQLQTRDPDTQFVYYANAGKARSKGLDVMLNGSISDDWLIAGTLSFNDSELSEPTPGVGIYGLEGDRLPFSAKFNGTLTVDKEFALGDSALKGFAGGTLAYVGKRYGNFAARSSLQRPTMPSYTTVDLRVGIRVDGWTFTLFGKNLADKRGIIGADHEVANGSTGLYVVNVIRPRTFGLSLAKEF